jgi:hypothetical protein
MQLKDMTLREAVDHLGNLLKQLLQHPEATQQDKASVVLIRSALYEITRRHLPRWTPCDPKTLPPRKPGQDYPTLPKGWAVDWEESKEGGHA